MSDPSWLLYWATEFAILRPFVRFYLRLWDRFQGARERRARKATVDRYRELLGRKQNQ